MRVVKEIEVGKRRLTALFDTGAVHTYIRRELLRDAPKIGQMRLGR
jgi:hypothetical protein